MIPSICTMNSPHTQNNYCIYKLTISTNAKSSTRAHLNVYLLFKAKTCPKYLIHCDQEIWQNSQSGKTRKIRLAPLSSRFADSFPDKTPCRLASRRDLLFPKIRKPSRRLFSLCLPLSHPCFVEEPRSPRPAWFSARLLHSCIHPCVLYPCPIWSQKKELEIKTEEHGAKPSAMNNPPFLHILSFRRRRVVVLEPPASPKLLSQ